MLYVSSNHEYVECWQFCIWSEQLIRYRYMKRTLLICGIITSITDCCCVPCETKSYLFALCCCVVTLLHYVVALHCYVTFLCYFVTLQCCITMCPCHVTLRCYILMLRYHVPLQCYVKMLHYCYVATLCYITLCFVMLCFALLRYVTWHYAILHCYITLPHQFYTNHDLFSNHNLVVLWPKPNHSFNNVNPRGIFRVRKHDMRLMKTYLENIFLVQRHQHSPYPVVCRNVQYQHFLSGVGGENTGLLVIWM